MQHEGNAAVLRIEFDPGWDGFAKTVTFWNARGEAAVKRILTTELLEDIAADARVYLCPIPPEAMTEAGRLSYVIDGMLDGVRQRSVEDRLKVLPAGYAPEAGASADPTPTQAEQLQVQVEALRGELQQGIAASGKAVSSAAAAAASEKNAAASETAAGESAGSAAASEQAAEDSAVTARSYAEGGTGTRQGEDRANAKYYMEQAQKMAGGEFLTEEQLEARLEQLTAADVGAAPRYVGSIMDTDLLAWAKAQTAGSVCGFYLPSRTPDNVPSSQAGYAFVYCSGVGGWAIDCITPADGKRYYNSTNSGVWRGWSEVYSTASRPTAAAIGAVPVSRTVNGKALSADVTLAAADVGAAAASHIHTAAQVGAAAASHTHTAVQVGAAAASHTHTAADVGAAAASHTHAAADVGAAAASHTHTAADVGAAPRYVGSITDTDLLAWAKSQTAGSVCGFYLPSRTPDNVPSSQAGYAYVYCSGVGGWAIDCITPVDGRRYFNSTSGGVWRGWSEVYSTASRPALADLGVTASAADITAGTTALTTGHQYLVYE